MEANDAVLGDERCNSIDALLGCAVDGKENRCPRQQRPHARANPEGATLARSAFKLLQLPKRKLSPEVCSDARSELEASKSEFPNEDEASQTRSARRRAGRSDVRMSPVAPLRFEHDVNAARLKLLGTKSSKAKQLPLKTRQYVYELAPKTGKREDRAASDSDGVASIEVAVTRAASVQTANTVDDKIIQTSCASSSSTSSPSRLSECSPAGEVAQEQASAEESSDQADKKEARAIGIQCQLREPTPSARVIPRNIAGRFPIWIDLEASASETTSSVEPKKYLQVVTFTGRPIDTDSGRLIVPRPVVETIRTEDSNNVDGVNPVEADVSVITHDETQRHDAVQAASAAHRECYRLHYASTTAKTETKTSAEGVQALVEVQNDMDRMKQRLRELEELADSMDYDFKLTYQILGGDDDEQQASDKMKTQQALNRVDQVLQDTEVQSDHTQHIIDLKVAPPMGILTQKATNDAAAARALLEQIEQLTSE